MQLNYCLLTLRNKQLFMIILFGISFNAVDFFPDLKIIENCYSEKTIVYYRPNFNTILIELSSTNNSLCSVMPSAVDVNVTFAKAVNNPAEPYRGPISFTFYGFDYNKTNQIEVKLPAGFVFAYHFILVEIYSYDYVIPIEIYKLDSRVSSLASCFKQANITISPDFFEIEMMSTGDCQIQMRTVNQFSVLIQSNVMLFTDFSPGSDLENMRDDYAAGVRITLKLMAETPGEYLKFWDVSQGITTKLQIDVTGASIVVIYDNVMYNSKQDIYDQSAMVLTGEHAWLLKIPNAKIDPWLQEIKAAYTYDMVIMRINIIEFGYIVQDTYQDFDKTTTFIQFHCSGQEEELATCQKQQKALMKETVYTAFYETLFVSDNIVVHVHKQKLNVWYTHFRDGEIRTSRDGFKVLLYQDFDNFRGFFNETIDIKFTTAYTEQGSNYEVPSLSFSGKYNSKTKWIDYICKDSDKPNPARNETCLDIKNSFLKQHSIVKLSYTFSINGKTHMEMLPIIDISKVDYLVVDIVPILVGSCICVALAIYMFYQVHQFKKLIKKERKHKNVAKVKQ